MSRELLVALVLAATFAILMMTMEKTFAARLTDTILSLSNAAAALVCLANFWRTYSARRRREELFSIPSAKEEEGKKEKLEEGEESFAENDGKRKKTTTAACSSGFCLRNRLPLVSLSQLEKEQAENLRKRRVEPEKLKTDSSEMPRDRARVGT